MSILGLRRTGVLPGFGVSAGVTLGWLTLMVLVPLTALLVRASSLSASALLELATQPRAVAAYRLSFGASLAAATIDAVFGLLLAWVLVRYDFPGRKLVDAIIDLPFALPTAVAGIALTTLYAENGPIGAPLRALGIKVAFTPLGVTAALAFIGIPFVVRSVQPVLESLDAHLEEAAATLGASRLQTFRLVLLPALMPALLTGFALALARGLGEYGSVVFISGNLPFETEIVPLLIVTKLEQYDYAGATAIAGVMLLFAFALLFVINVLQRWAGRIRA